MKTSYFVKFSVAFGYYTFLLLQFTSHHFTFTSAFIARAMFETYLSMHVGFQVGHGEFLSAFTASVTT